ncbi:MAG: GIY-YIG nuclease family protein [Candidatus Brocadiia bacterium]
MKYVYLLQSLSNPKKRCTGVSADFHERLKQHYAGESPTTAKRRPWKPVVVLSFEDDAKAEAFERYLKFGSGHAFAAKHFW